MEQQLSDREGSSTTAAPKTRPAGWVAPLQSMTVLSIVEFTRPSLNAGNDGAGTSTAS